MLVTSLSYRMHMIYEKLINKCTWCGVKMRAVHSFLILFVIELIVVVVVVRVAGVLDLVLDFLGFVLHLRQHRLLLSMLVLVLVLIPFLRHFFNTNTKKPNNSVLKNIFN